MTCKAIRQIDEMFCHKCGLRWDVTDPEPPQCRKPRVVVGLTGPSGCGKSTLARYMRDRHGYMILDMAAPIRDMLRVILVARGSTDPDTWLTGDDRNRPCPFLSYATPRHAMQTLGTEWGREIICPNIWIDIAIDTISATDQNVVIENIRFDNEASLCDKIIRLKGRGGIDARHVSEQGVQRCDMGFVNSGTVEEMHSWFDYINGLL